jgi:hypothetical protein
MSILPLQVLNKLFMNLAPQRIKLGHQLRISPFVWMIFRRQVLAVFYVKIRVAFQAKNFPLCTSDDNPTKKAMYIQVLLNVNVYGISYIF